jgi:hypothetical protein
MSRTTGVLTCTQIKEQLLAFRLKNPSALGQQVYVKPSDVTVITNTDYTQLIPHSRIITFVLMGKEGNITSVRVKITRK